MDTEKTEAIDTVDELAMLRVHGAGSGGFNGVFKRIPDARNGKPVWEKPEGSHRIEFNGFEWRMFSAASPDDGRYTLTPVIYHPTRTYAKQIHLIFFLDFLLVSGVLH